ncbi:MAG: sulfite exporter TauE/SafE family protein [Myxococcales bacterium]|nr:sulfite exporter TauE/SafE family protein [Myxococcales bacterium]
MFGSILGTWGIGAWGALVIGGFACGFLNTLAGGGSLITMPLLILLGLDPIAANATNRLALTVQYSTAVWGFRRHGVPLASPIGGIFASGFVGCLVGTGLALVVPPAVFQRILGVAMLLALIPLFTKGKEWFSQESSEETKQPGLLLFLCFWIGLYSGFIQVGVGVWSLLVLLGVGGFDIRKANATKAWLLAGFALLSTVLFIWAGKIVWVAGAILAIGNAGGAWFAAKIAAKHEMSWVRWLVLFAVLAASAKMLGAL